MDVVGWVGVPDATNAGLRVGGHTAQLEGQRDFVSRAGIEKARRGRIRKIAKRGQDQTAVRFRLTARHLVRNDASLLWSRALSAPRTQRNGREHQQKPRVRALLEREIVAIQRLKSLPIPDSIPPSFFGGFDDFLPGTIEERPGVMDLPAGGVDERRGEGVDFRSGCLERRIS